MNFEFATANHILFAWNTFERVVPIVAEHGRSALIVVGREGRYGRELEAGLVGRGLRSVTVRVDGEPTIRMVDLALAVAREESCDVVVAVGGGSVIDAGKAIAGMARQPGDLLDHLEVVGEGRPLVEPPLPFIAVPTTAGTGSEVTRNAVLDVPSRRVKVSLRSPFLLPRVAIVDPALTLSLPPKLTALTGMDALTQLIEPFVSLAANPLTDGLCREGIALASRSLLTAYRTGSDRRAREEMAAASLLGGLALANAKLGAVHGLAGILGGMFGLAHGAICARLLPYVMERNVERLEAVDPECEALRRYDEISRILTGNPAASARDGIAWVHRLCLDLNVEPLEIDASGEEMDAVINGAQRASSMKGNPVLLTDDDLRSLVKAAS